LRACTAAAIVLTLLILPSCNLQTGVALSPDSETLVFLDGFKILVIEQTSCHSGPGQGYDEIGTLIPGQELSVVGRSSAGDYWLINSPLNPETVCWLESTSATMNFNPELLPVFTPPPTPTPVESSAGGCPTPIGGGPTPISCNGASSGSGCPTPVGGGPTPIYCGSSLGSGCPTPIGGGPTPVSCSSIPPESGCPTPIGGGPTPVYCGSSLGSGCPAPYTGGPTPFSCPTKVP
jgi:hypothetical protein